MLVKPLENSLIYGKVLADDRVHRRSVDNIKRNYLKSRKLSIAVQRDNAASVPIRQLCAGYDEGWFL